MIEGDCAACVGESAQSEFVREGERDIDRDRNSEPIRGNHFIFQRQPEEDECDDDRCELGVSEAIVESVFGGDGFLAECEAVGVFDVWVGQRLPPVTELVYYSIGCNLTR